MQENQFQPHEQPNQDVPQTETQDTVPGQKKVSAQTGPIIGSIVIIIVLVLGGLYFIGEKVNDEGLFEPSMEEIQKAPDEILGTLQEQGASDAVEEIEEDLDATILDNLDAELQNIEVELNF
ncbi:hypothetical protein CL630_01880 [bacterium]|nr:hypothetical protein [bacterium]|tara:strand:- start:6722 stop:7087 length:366 start_codon:yes stop_codon:yes gene_type:complete